MNELSRETLFAIRTSLALGHTVLYLASLCLFCISRPH